MLKNSIIICIVLLLFALPVYAQDLTATDTTNISIGSWTLGWAGVPFGVVCSGSDDPNTQLEAKPFIGTGGSLTFMTRKNWGLIGSALFYTEGEMIYPMASFGITMFKGKFATSLGWNFGKTSSVLKSSVQRRLVVLMSINITSLAQ